MPAQLKKVVPDPYSLHTQRIRIHRAQHLLFRSPRELLFMPFFMRGRQCAAINLAARRQRPCRKNIDYSGNHVFGKLAAEVLLQSLNEHRLCVVRNYISAKLFDGAPFMNGDNCVADLRMGPQSSFNFTQLNAEATNFYLMIGASEELKLTGGRPANQIASPVHALSSGRGERISNKPLGSERRALPISSCHSLTTNIKFAGNAKGHRLEITIQNVQAGIGNRSPDRDNWTAPNNSDEGGLNSGFRRPVGIPELGFEMSIKQLSSLGLQGLSAACHDSKRLPLCYERMIEHGVQQRGSEINICDSLLNGELEQVIDVTFTARVSNGNSRATGERQENFQNGSIEAERSLLQYTVT